MEVQAKTRDANRTLKLANAKCPETNTQRSGATETEGIKKLWESKELDKNDSPSTGTTCG